jgi:hypothetical protein
MISISAVSGGYVAAVAAKEAAAGRNGSLTPPASPLIPVGHEGMAALDDHLLLPAAAADAQVIIRSASSNSMLKETSAAAVLPAACGSNGSSQHGESPVEYGVCQDEAGCDSSSLAGAGGPSVAAAAGC